MDGFKDLKTQEFVSRANEQAEELKRAAHHSVRKVQAKIQEHAPEGILQTANAIEHSPHVQTLLNSPVPFFYFVASLLFKTLVSSMVKGSLPFLVALDVVIISGHIWFNASSQVGKPTRVSSFSKEAEFESPLSKTTTTPTPQTFTVDPAPSLAAVSIVVESAPLVVVTSSSIPAMKSNQKMIAGSSTMRLNTTPIPGVDKMSYKDVNASCFRVRQVNYKKTSQKAESLESMYELVAFDLFQNKSRRLFNVGSHACIELPGNRPCRSPTQLPGLFIVNAQIPDKAPSLMGTSNKDDFGFSLVFYFHLKPWVSQLGNNHNNAGVKLLQRYVKEHATNPEIRRRFKAMGMVDNIRDLGAIGAMVEGFNGKPAIINKVATIFEGDNWFEVDISIYDFPYMALRALHGLKEKVSEIGLKAGFTMQGETDEELPELLLGGVECCIDFASAKVLE